MIRCMMLALTMILITLSAAFLGRDEQLRQVLQQTKIPIENAVISETAPHQYQTKTDTFSSSEHHSSSPRFIPDEPISRTALAESTSEPSSSELPIDPSAEAQLFPIESNEKDYVPTPPTEQQKLIAAEPFVKELFELTERGKEELRVIINQAVGEFLSASPLERGNVIPSLIEKYTPVIMELETNSDKEAEAILLRMSAALVAIGADDGLVTDAREAYQYSKQQQISHYTNLFSSFVPSSQSQ